MKNGFYIFLYIFLLITNILLLTLWNDKPDGIESKAEIEKLKLPPQIIIKKELPIEYKFTFIDIENIEQKITVKKNNYTFIDIDQPIILISFFSTWCPPCIGQIPHLNKLQKRYKDDLSVFGLLIHDNIKVIDLNKFVASQRINFFISNHQEQNIKFSNFIAPKLQLNSNFPLPLMILFVKGRYYTHYEGSIPEEMIESDIQQALKKTKG